MNAFDGGAFDFNAFDVGGVEPTPTPVTFGGGYYREPYPQAQVMTDDDDEILLAWFMFMRQPHER